jgi:hypothetical protein
MQSNKDPEKTYFAVVDISRLDQEQYDEYERMPDLMGYGDTLEEAVADLRGKLSEILKDVPIRAGKNFQFKPFSG